MIQTSPPHLFSSSSSVTPPRRVHHSSFDHETSCFMSISPIHRSRCRTIFVVADRSRVAHYLGMHFLARLPPLSEIFVRCVTDFTACRKLPSSPPPPPSPFAMIQSRLKCCG